jgi:TPP-dependent pyruvate/acetoin dehydrogenase alpha subunit
MYKIRQFEKAAYDLYTKNLIRGSIHLYLGEEAVATGICANLKKDDYITSTHRGHGHCIAKGGELKPMMAELLGKKTGYCKGKGGSMHIADPKIGIYGANGIVGGGIGIATGLAFSIKYFNQKKVVICFFGDGAFNQGVLFEVINMSVAWKLPIIFICENNYYALSTHYKEFSKDNKLLDKVKGFGIITAAVDGNDIKKVYNTSKKIINNTRSNNEPGFIETFTYRWTGHFLGDKEVYRTKKEVDNWKKRCPIDHYIELLKNEGFKIELINQIKGIVNTEVKEAIEFALSSPEPELNSIFEDIYTS